MNNKNKVIWSEGMMLRQQHFQQQERYLTELIRLSSPKPLPDNYGFYQLDLAHNFLPLKKILINSAEGVFPDGTHFILGNQANATVEPLEFTENVFDLVVYLCLPSDIHNIPPYKHEVTYIQDENDSSSSEEPIVIGKLNLFLKTSNDDLSQFITLPIGKVKYCNNIEGIVFEKKFMIPALAFSAVIELKQELEEMVGLITQRVTILADRVATPSKQYVADMREWLLLQTLNRYHLIWKHSITRIQQHPIHFYYLLLQLISELSTFTSQKKYFDGELNYQQNDLYQTFSPLFSILREQLNQVIEFTSLAIILEKTPQGWWQSTVLNSDVFDSCQLIIAAKSDLSQDELQARFLTQVKVASADQIYSLLHSQLPGLALEILPTVPPSIPYHAGYLYFTTSTNSKLWQDLKKFGQFAIHATAQLPKLDINCWMIRR